jgi:hypothetical protein
MLERLIIKNRLKKIMLLYATLAFIIFFGLFGVRAVRADWREPTAPPPTENISPPLTVGGEPQGKAGRLKLDPNFNPDDLTTLLTYPLEVAGTGKVLEGVAENLRVADTLFVSAEEDKVDIASKPTTNSAKLTVYGGKVQVGTELNPISGQALWGESVSGHGILGTTLASSSSQVYAGVSGENNNALGYGVWGLSSSSGVNARSGVYGQTTGGTGIYGVTNSYLFAAVYGENTAASNMGWAGYFAGNLGAGSDVVSGRFLPTTLRPSLISFTSGQQISSLNIPGTFSWPASWYYPVSVFDGTYVWAAPLGVSGATGNLFKIRASDSVIVASYRLEDGVAGRNGISSLAFDGRNVWAGTFDGGRIIQFDTVTDTQIGVYGDPSVSGLEVEVVDIKFTTLGSNKYLWASIRNSNNTLRRFLRIDADDPNSFVSIDRSRFNSTCNPFGSAFDGQYVWLICDASSVYRLWAEDPNDANYPVDTLPLAGSPYTRSIVFDGRYMWVTSYVVNYVTRYYASAPNDPLHPRLEFHLPVSAFGASPEPKGLTFDGANIWVILLNDMSDPNSANLLRVPASVSNGYCENNGNQCYTNNDCGGSVCAIGTGDYKKYLLPNVHPANVIFDGTYFWLPNWNEASQTFSIKKVYSGTGKGHTDLNTVVNLNPALAQTGNFNISGTAEVGGTLSVGGDLATTNNAWDPNGDDAPENVPPGGSADCLVSGHFINRVTIGADHKISAIVCRGL